MIMCVLLCYPLSIHMSQLLSTGRPISSFFLSPVFALGLGNGGTLYLMAHQNLGTIV